MSDEPTERDVVRVTRVLRDWLKEPVEARDLDAVVTIALATRKAVAEMYAERIAQARREAWDEGYSQGVADERMSQETTAGEIPPGRVNPHRAALRGDA